MKLFSATAVDAAAHRRFASKGPRGAREARRPMAAFTLVEAMIAAGIAVILVAGCFSAILVDQVAVRKAKEESLVMDFLTSYTENIKALPFANVGPGQPINNLYNGANGAPLIAIPASTNWISLTNSNYQTFYPDLVWLGNRNPQMQVNLKQNSVSGSLHDMEFNVKVDWNSPLGKGARLEVQVDFTRAVDVPTL